VVAQSVFFQCRRPIKIPGVDERAVITCGEVKI
jgi:hypothetical protein